jgi:hypothetical protein
MNKKELITKMFEIIGQDGEEYTDGEILDQICALLNDEESKES